MTKIIIPKSSLVLPCGVPGSGKSTFGKQVFSPTEIVSSDTIRSWLSDNESDQSVSKTAFSIAETIVETRMKIGRTTYFDATNVKYKSQEPFIELAKTYNRKVVLLIFDTPIETSKTRNLSRSRVVPESVIDNMQNNFSTFMNSVLTQEDVKHLYDHIFHVPLGYSASQIVRE